MKNIDKNHEIVDLGTEDLRIKDEQISFDHGQVFETKEHADIPVDIAEEVKVDKVKVDTAAPVLETVEVVQEEPVMVEETIAAPVAVEEIPDAQYVAPVAEAHRRVWPWALGALALAGLVTGLAWPHTTTTPVAEPVVTASPVAAVRTVTEAPAVVTTAIPTCDGGQLVVTAATELRAVASADANSLTTLAANSPVTITSEGTDGWFPVVSGTMNGFIPTTAVACQMTVTG